MNKPEKTYMIPKKRGTHAEIERKQNRWVVIGFSITAVIILLLIGYGVLYEKVLKFRTTVANVGNLKISSQDFIERVKYYRNYYVNQYEYYQQLAQMFATDDSTLASFNQQLSSYQYYLDDSKQFAEDVLDQMIFERVVELEAEKKGIVVSEKEIDEFLKVQFGFFPNGTPTSTPTSIALPTATFSATQKAIIKYTPEAIIQPTLGIEPTEAADSTPTPELPSGQGSTPEPTATLYTQELFDQNVQETINNLKVIGVSEGTYRQIIKYYLLQNKLKNTYEIDPEKSEQVWARHILLQNEVDAAIVIDRIKDGEDWAAVASEKSLDTGTKDNGGDLGWFARGMMVAPFEEAAYSLGIGEISSPVQTDFGWHVIQVIGHDMLAMTYDTWITQAQKSTEISKQNWENLVPTEPSIPEGLRISTSSQ